MYFRNRALHQRNENACPHRGLVMFANNPRMTSLTAVARPRTVHTVPLLPFRAPREACLDAGGATKPMASLAATTSE